MTELDYISHLRSDGEALAAAADAGPLTAPVAACPEWDLAELVRHTGEIHRWATEIVRTGARPERGSFEKRPPDGVELGTWIRDGVATLTEMLSSVDPHAPTWHVFPVPMVAGVWPRRQAHETAIHRWDAETAIGLRAEMDAQLASDGIDEYFEVILPRLGTRDSVAYPSGSLHVHCTDVAGEWLVNSDGSGLRVERAHAKGDAALRGRAADLLLTLWARPAGTVERVGDQAVADAWLALGGI